METKWIAKGLIAVEPGISDLILGLTGSKTQVPQISPKEVALGTS